MGFPPSHRFDMIMDGSVGISCVKQSQQCGPVALDETGRVVELKKKLEEPQSDHVISEGYVIKNRLFDELDQLK